MIAEAGCTVCGGTAWVPLLEHAAGHRYVACERCRTGRLDPLPTPEAAAAEFGEGYFEGATHGGYADYVADEHVHRANARRHLRRAARAGGPPPGSVLELGCAAGFLLDEARRAGAMAVHGVDVSAAMRGAARERFGLDVASGLDDLDVADGTVDAVVASQVLEHLVDPAAALERAAALLRPGGALVVETWDRRSLTARALGGRWHQVASPSVIWLFDRPGLRRLIEDAGFDVRSLRARPKLLSAATAGAALGVAVDSSRGGWRRTPLPYVLDDLVVGVAVRR